MSSRFWLLALWALAPIALAPARAEPFQISNAFLVVTAETPVGTFSVQDRRTGRLWTQQAGSHDLTFQPPETQPDSPLRLELRGTYAASHTGVSCVIELDRDRPEFTLTISARGPLPAPLLFPHPFAGGRDLIVPVNEGIRYPVDDATIAPRKYQVYSGHGICMPFWGLTDANGEAGEMTIIETEYDARVDLSRNRRGLAMGVQWDAQKGEFGYDRRLRYVFLDQGGYVAMCKRYRHYAQAEGRFKTLAEKEKERPAIDQLAGSVNVWCWDPKPVSLVREMQAAGIQRILWSNTANPWVAPLNALGVLTSKYDAYVDVIDPALIPQLPGGKVNPSWIEESFPHQVIQDKDQNWVRGWWVKSQTGKQLDCAILSDFYQAGYARRIIARDLRQSPYGCRFIDDTTAMYLHEDFGLGHEMTRTDCANHRIELLQVVSQEHRLVTGSETGMDWSIPYLDYFEGMLSLTPYRLQGAGHPMVLPWTAPVPENLTKFQTGAHYRLPLFELVYHECVVSTWYWYDGSNSIPAIWDRRDLFNILYGTQPMFRITRAEWEHNQARFAQSYRNTAPLERALAYSEMVDHQWLTPDALVQQTRFANGAVVTVNFGATAYALAPDRILPPGGFSISGITLPPR
jgi:hypothetical protein